MSSERPWLVGCFAASVMINLFLAGILTGRYLFEPRPPAQQNAAVMKPGAIRELPEEERLRFNVIMSAQGPALRTGRLKLRQLRQDVRDAISAPHYDAALVAKRFEALRAAQQAQQTLQQNTLSQALGQLSAQSRASVIQAETDAAASNGNNNANAGR
jgi:uncharacterized membrane protein